MASKLARSRPPILSTNLLDYGLQVCTITASKCISELARSRPPSVCPNSLDYGLQVLTSKATKCISKVARSRPRSVSLSSLDRDFQAHLELLLSTACSQSRHTVCRLVAIEIHRWEYKLNTWLLKIVERYVVAMISRRTSSVPKEDVFPRLLYCDSRCSQSCRRRSEACRRRTKTCRRRSQTCRRRSQTCCRRSQTCRRRSQALPGVPKVFSGAPRCSQTYHNHSCSSHQRSQLLWRPDGMPS